ncbi:GlxA family transcriptional regulator [Kiloniella majae]|uniref:GlxA family transcriptional regulator n=1 Tax=Kiloniella majae TaxID=1938558 RepID=UPI001302354B|nr:GlxA family transcriptional regulator [Kiloniella majae]
MTKRKKTIRLPDALKKNEGQTNNGRELPTKGVFVFLLLPNYSLLALSSAVEVLRAANRLSRSEIYSWQLVSADGGSYPSSGGLALSTETLDRPITDITHLVICGGDGSDSLRDTKTLSFVREHARRAKLSGAISDGSYLAARTGIFDGYKSTIHWQCYDGYVEQNPDLEITRQIYEIDRDRFSCAGGNAAFDLFLQLVERDYGRHLSLEIAENFVHSDIRPQVSPQRLNPSFKFAASSPRLSGIIEHMEQNLETPLSLPELAKLVDITARQMDRIFQQYVGESPSKFYIDLRVRRAAHLLRQTNLAISEIAVACGFASSSHLAKHFQRIWRMSPREYRIL